MSLLVTLTGKDSATVTEVSLVALSGSEEVRGVVEPQGSGNFLVQLDRTPSAEFLVQVKGQNGGVTTRASTAFQRVSSTNFRSSNLTVSVSTHLRPSL